MIPTEIIKELVRHTAEIYEASYVDGAYEITLKEATEIAVKYLNDSDYAGIEDLIYFAMFSWWNDTLDWAKESEPNG